MAYPKAYIDAMLLNWGDRLFQEPFRHVSAPRLSRAIMRDEATRTRDQLARTLRCTPEVMVKVTNKASSAQGMGAVRRHLRYISRNGHVELEDQDGDRISGAEAVRDLARTWQLGGWGIPEASHRREVFNVLLSMPPGTNRQAVRDAARDFAAIEFGDGRAYVFAAHDDEAHPHVHLSVQVRGPDGRRLNPRRQNLRQWRERFAEQLRTHGVEANATPRRARGVTQRYPKQGVLAAWREIAQAMAASPERPDREMAVDITDFVRAMPLQQDAPTVINRRQKKAPPQPDRTSPEHDNRAADPGPEVDR
jgi:hypothetical protein